MVWSNLSSYGSLSSPSGLSRSPLMNVPFDFSKSLIKIYRTQNNHEHLTDSKPPAQNQNGRRTRLSHTSARCRLKTLPNLVTPLMLRACRDEHVLF